MGLLGTLVLGLVGSLVGGFLLSLLDRGEARIAPAGVVGSIIGAIVVLLIWRAASGRRAFGRRRTLGVRRF